MAPPSGTTATTTGPTPAPPSPGDARGKPPRSARSGSWRRPRYWSGRRPGRPRGPPTTPNCRARNQCRPGRLPPHAQAAALAAPPPEGTPNAQGVAAAPPASHATSLGTPPARGRGTAQAPSALPGTGTAAAEGRVGAKYRAHAKLSHTHVSPPKATRRKAAFPAAQAHAAGHQAAAAAAAPGPGGGGRPSGGATGARSEGRRATEGGWYAVEEDKRQGRRGQQRQGRNTSQGPGCLRRRERAGPGAGRQCKQQQGRGGTPHRQGREQRKEGHRAPQGARAGARERHGRQWKSQGRG